MKRVLAICFTVFSIQAAAQTKSGLYRHPFQLPDKKYEHVFQNTLVFGHSISSNLMYDIKKGAVLYSLGVPFAGPLISTALWWVLPSYAPSPGEIMANNVNASTQNKAKGFGNFGFEDLGFGKMIQLQGRDVRHFTLGGQRSLFPKNNKMEQSYKEATVLVGVDAFYMGVIFNDCAYYNVPAVMSEFVEQAYADGKVTILGNFPDEKFARMNILTKQVLGEELSEDQLECQAIVNSALERFCTADKNCYTIDLKQIVNDMDKNNGAMVAGRKFSYKELRPDGANLSAAGSQLIIEKIIEALDKNPPLQSKDQSIFRK